MKLCLSKISILLLLLSIPALAINKETKQTSVLEQAISLFKAGEKKQAEELLKQYIQSADYQKIPQRSLIYRSYITLADIYSRRSAYHEETKLFQQLIIHLNNWQLTQSVDMVTVKQRLGEALIHLGQEIEGIQNLQQGLDLAIKIFPTKDIRLANLRLILAKAHINRLEVNPATKLLEQAKVAISINKDQNSQIVLGRIIQAQGELLFRQAKTKKASLVYLNALNFREKLFGFNHLETAQSLISYAGSLKGLHRLSEAEELYRQGFSIYDSQLGAEHIFIATILNNMGQLYYLQGRYDNAEKVLLRALAIKQKHFSKDHISLAQTYNHLGYLYFYRENYQKAEQYLDEAIRIWSLPNSSRPRYAANAGVWKAIIWYHQGKKPQDALERFQELIQTLQSIYGDYNIATADAFYYLGQLYQDQNDFDKAELAYLNGIKSASQFGQGDWLAEILIHSKLARLYVEASQLKLAIAETQASLRGLQLRIKRFSGLRAHSLTTELKSLRDSVINNISVLYTILQADPENTVAISKAELLEETFKAAQISRSSSVARALAQVEQRFASGTDKLAKIIRERQDLIEEWQEIDAILSAAMSNTETLRNRKKENDLSLLSKQIKLKIEGIDQQLKEKYPNYTNLTQSPPLTIKQVQNLLHPNESLLVFLFGKEKSFLWTITPDKAEIFQLDMFEKKLERMVRRLRNRLQPGPNQSENNIAPFPVKQAHLLYRKILQPAMPLLESSQKLFIVSDQALQSIPLSVLVTQLPQKQIRKAAAHHQADWLINQKTLVSLPAVSALSTLRQHKSPHLASINFLGIGDPALKDAFQKQQLRTLQLQHLRGKPKVQNLNKPLTRGATLSSRIYRGTNIALRSILGNRSANVDIEKISSMSELPDTSEELHQVSKILSGSQNRLYLRNQATKNQLLQTDTDKFKVIQFATHGLMAGEFQGLFEPALVLTPDIDNDINDNGLLTTSDISQLKLNADFVVLSACNTAAPDGTPGAEGLSGLGRAFFYAGSKALMVTHWAVISDAAVKMTTQIFDSMHNNDNMDIALAHQQSTLKLMHNKEKPYYAHPMFWAPFMIVGGND